MDEVQAICKKIDIKNSRELSLAKAQRNSDKMATQCNSASQKQLVDLRQFFLPFLDQWLDPHSSLNAQGIKDGDSLLLR